MYAEIYDLEQRLGVIFGEIYGGDAAAAQSDLDSAAAEINGALAARYRIPVTRPAALPLLRDWTLTLTEERSYARAAGSEFAEKVKLRVEQVRKYLQMIRDDQFKLDADENTGGGSGNGIALVQAEKPLFSRDDLGGF